MLFFIGITRHGRVAILTNVRDNADGYSPTSRGELVRDFLLSSSVSPWSYCEDIAKRMDEFGGKMID